MEFFHKDIDRKDFTLYPLGDWHYGSPQCDVQFVQKMVNMVRDDPAGYWCGMGDLMENALIGSKSDVYTQLMPPKDQMDAIVEMLTPIGDKGLFLIAGNHELRTMRMAGVMPEQYIGIQLHMPFTGYSCMATFHLMKSHKSARGFSAYFHHNTGGGRTPGGKVNNALRLRDIAPTVDATFSGHFHTTARTPVTWHEPGIAQAIRCIGYDYITGSALTWDKSYAEEKTYPSSAVEHIKVTFVGGNGHGAETRKQIYEVVTK